MSRVGSHGVVASSYAKQVGPIPYGTIIQDALMANGESRRTYNGTGNGNFEDYIGNWSGGIYPGYQLQMYMSAFMEASPPGIHYIGLSIGGVWVINSGLQEAPGGGGSNLATGWLNIGSGYTGAMYVLDGTSFADNAHFKFVDLYYRYVRS